VTIERLMVAVVAASVLLAHDVGRMLSQSFWNDESWVAVTTRFPISDVASTTASTPIGWTVLLRLFPFGGPEGLRLLPLVFAAGAVVAGYTLASGLGWNRRTLAVGAGLGCAYAVLMNPAMLVRNDLKQYTADAAFALVVLTLTSRVERQWSRLHLGLLAGVIAVGMLFSHTTAFVGAAAFVALVAVQLWRRSWRTALEAAVAGGVALAGMLTVYEVWDARGIVPALTYYWRNYYFARGSGVRHFLSWRWHAIEQYLGLGPIWLAAPLVIAGVVTIARLARPATALAVCLLFVEMPIVSALRKYPYLDERTSTFLFVVFAVVAGIGVVSIGVALSRWIHAFGAIALALAAAVALTIHGANYARTQTVPAEDPAQQIAYVDRHRAPGDVIVVNSSSSYAFGYYWRNDKPSIQHSAVAGPLQYFVTYPEQSDIVALSGRACAQVSAGLSAGLQRMSGRPAAQLWLIRTHVNTAESRCWTEALADPALVVTSVGPPGLDVIRFADATGGQVR
jgi:hypothetical protein